MDIDWNNPWTWIVAAGACFVVIGILASISEIMSNANEAKRLRLREREINELMKDD